MIKLRYLLFIVVSTILTSQLNAADLNFVRKSVGYLNTCLQNVKISAECPKLIQAVDDLGERDFQELESGAHGATIRSKLCNYFQSKKGNFFSETWRKITGRNAQSDFCVEKRDYSFLDKGRIFAKEVIYGVGGGTIVIVAGGSLLPASVTLAAAVSASLIVSSYIGLSEGADRTTLIAGVGVSVLVVAAGGAYYLLPVSLPGQIIPPPAAPTPAPAVPHDDDILPAPPGGNGPDAPGPGDDFGFGSDLGKGSALSASRLVTSLSSLPPLPPSSSELDELDKPSTSHAAPTTAPDDSDESSDDKPSTSGGGLAGQATGDAGPSLTSSPAVLSGGSGEATGYATEAGLAPRSARAISGEQTEDARGAETDAAPHPHIPRLDFTRLVRSAEATVAADAPLTGHLTEDDSTEDEPKATRTGHLTEDDQTDTEQDAVRKARSATAARAPGLIQRSPSTHVSGSTSHSGLSRPAPSSARSRRTTFQAVPRFGGRDSDADSDAPPSTRRLPPTSARTLALRKAREEKRLAEAESERLADDLAYTQARLASARNRNRKLAERAALAERAKDSASTVLEETQSHLTSLAADAAVAKHRLEETRSFARWKYHENERLKKELAEAQDALTSAGQHSEALFERISALEAEQSRNSASMRTAGMLGKSLIEEVLFLKSLARSRGSSSSSRMLSADEFAAAHPDWFNPVGNGHCMYSAIAHLTDGYSAANIHQAAMAHILANSAHFHLYTEGGVNTFLNEHLEPGTWGDYVVLTAIANQLNIHFIVHQFNIYGQYTGSTHINQTPGANLTLTLANFANLHFFAPPPPTVAPEIDEADRDGGLAEDDEGPADGEEGPHPPAPDQT